MKNILFIVLASLLLSQCKLFKKEVKPELPPETQEGKRTVDCKVDREIWLPEYSKRGLSAGSGFQMTYELFKVYPPFSSGLSRITQARYTDNTGDFVTDSLHTGVVTITKLDRQRAIISGTFYFDAYNKKTGKVVKITEGRFDYPVGR
jgi:hypothetical protein